MILASAAKKYRSWSERSFSFFYLSSPTGQKAGEDSESFSVKKVYLRDSQDSQDSQDWT
jgi:hypothetical protein